uniref:Uncharacterized protein n=1 Tax=Knipowitschia caucasica TaxID=637954 RepID=A0AAV2LT41_KNICA
MVRVCERAALSGLGLSGTISVAADGAASGLCGGSVFRLRPEPGPEEQNITHLEDQKENLTYGTELELKDRGRGSGPDGRGVCREQTGRCSPGGGLLYVPVDHVTAAVPVDRVTAAVPVDHLTADVPVDRVTADVPVDPVTPDVPVDRVTADVPVDRVTADVPVLLVSFSLASPALTDFCFLILSRFFLQRWTNKL